MRAFRTGLLPLLLCTFLCGATGVPSQQIYDKNGRELRTLLSKQTAYYLPVTLDQVSPWLIAASVAAEDKRFFTHSGVDSAAVLRAAWQNTRQREVVSGASTITQQLVRTLRPRPKNWWGKMTEAFSAVDLERKYTKEEILEQYFNSVEWGNLTQGVQAASLFYFNRSAADLSLAQSALLIGMVKSPTYYNPLTHPARSIKRQQYVLKRMREENLIDEEMYQMALEEPLTFASQKRAFEAPHFVEFLKPLLPSNESFIYTTLDSEVQNFADKTVKNQLAYLASNNVTNGAVVVVDNQTGGILAYVGSGNFYDNQHNGQVDGARALRQPGSALKPFVYGLAFETGKLTPATLLDDKDTFFEGGFRPHNYDEQDHGPVSVRTALASSYNIPAVLAAEKVGVDPLLVFLRRLGISLPKNADFYGLGISLGNGEVRLLDLTNAYATLARGGVFKPLKLADKPTLFLEGKSQRVLTETTSFLITHILADNQARMPAFGLNSPLYVPFEFAAKTGTSKDYKDNFALGYTARWTIGVWVGNFDATSMEKVSGVTGAGPILHEIALFMQQHYPSAPFEEPNGIVHKTVCNESGLLASAACEHTRDEVFDATQKLPAHCSGKHQKEVVSLRITRPSEGDIYKIDPAVARNSQQIQFAAECSQHACSWTLNNKPLPQKECSLWWPLASGKYTLSVSCGAAKAHTHFEVLE